MAGDPRAENCRGFRVADDGSVTGVELEVQVRPGTRFELARVELIDEDASQGNTVATCVVVDTRGIPIGARVFMAWPWPNLAAKALPGNPSGQHMIMNGYKPPEKGPLALFVGDEQGNVISDVVGGLGLPFNRHICFRATWWERDADPDAPDDPDDEDVDGFGALVFQTERIANALEALCRHLGVKG